MELSGELLLEHRREGCTLNSASKMRIPHFQDAVSEGVSMRQKSASQGNVPHSSVLSGAVITPRPRAT